MEIDRTKKIIKYLSLAILMAFVGIICFVRFALPMVGDAEDIKIERTKTRIERGRYLANNVCVCMDCHSNRDFNKFPAPVAEGTLGMGGAVFGKKAGFPGDFYAKNITPFGLKDWSDGEILRSIACGVSKNGKALYTEMPYDVFGRLDKEDLYSIVAYLRTMTPVENKVPDSDPDFLESFIINTLPEKAHYSKLPNRSDKVAYGKYIFDAANCVSCHTPLENGKPIAGKDLAGGFKFPMPTGGAAYSANITPDVETGIGSWSEERFVSTFKMYADSTFKPRAVNKGDFNTLMPWTLFSGMKTEDLKALYAYLRTVKPVRNEVVKFRNE